MRSNKGKIANQENSGTVGVLEEFAVVSWVGFAVFSTALVGVAIVVGVEVGVIVGEDVAVGFEVVSG